MTVQQFLKRWLMHYIHPEYFYIPLVNSEPSYVLIDKYVTENGTYNPSDDGADGYSKVTVEVGNITPLYVTSNGSYESWDYGYDGFCPVIVDVQPSFSFCDGIEYNDITPILDDEDGELYIYDESAGFGVRCAIEQSGTGYAVVVYKVWSSGGEYPVYRMTSDFAFKYAYITVTDSSTGKIKITYEFRDVMPGKKTYSKTISDLRWYGGSGNTFTVKRAVHNDE